MAQPVSSAENKEISRLRERLTSRLEKTRLTAFSGLADQGEAGRAVLREMLIMKSAPSNGPARKGRRPLMCGPETGLRQ